jgi:rfaE bifunctional protein kinase chain/domain/rfaE bifunctional protein nucleotidyltransferase chain/domain
LFNHYRHKIRTAEEIQAILGPRPRQKKVVMCHGVFDIVHPGHIRHLLYAKGKGDILIASLTCDEYVSKGEARPYVPHELRAANLAALEMVDYVLIDTQPEPLTNIATLQPDVFVKGYEYSAGGVHPKTREEIDLVASYGGEFVFSPGDVVYSSTQILAQYEPPLRLEKLLTLMEGEGVTFDHLRQTLNSLPGTKVHVVGDLIVDKYSYCTLLGPSTKTPTLSVKLDQSQLFVGGAGIVAKHLRSLGAEVTLTTVWGDDPPAAFAAEDLLASGIHLNAVCDPSRPSTVKERFWASNYKLLQVDTVDNSPLSSKYVQAVQERVRDTPTDVIIFSDFRHGLFQSDSIGPLTKSIPSGPVKVADSQVSNRWGNILDFKGFDLITPNEHEARHALGDQDSGIRSLARRLLIESKARCLILKLGERGLLAYRHPLDTLRSFFYIDSFVDRLVDPVGAGDALLAVTSLALARSQDLVQSAILGDLAAAVACAAAGNVPVGREEILQRCLSLEKIAQGIAV